MLKRIANGTQINIKIIYYLPNHWESHKQNRGKHKKRMNLDNKSKLIGFLSYLKCNQQGLFTFITGKTEKELKTTVLHLNINETVICVWLKYVLKFQQGRHTIYTLATLGHKKLIIGFSGTTPINFNPPKSKIFIAFPVFIMKNRLYILQIVSLGLPSFATILSVCLLMGLCAY